MVAFTDFSMVKYMGELGVNTNVGQLPNYAVDLLMEDLEVAGFLQEPQCELNSYAGALANGWDTTGKWD